MLHVTSLNAIIPIAVSASFKINEMMYQQRFAETEKEMKRRKREVDTYEQNRSDFGSFEAIIRKYVGIKELTPAIVNEFIKKS